MRSSGLVQRHEWLYDGRAWLWFGWLCVAAGVIGLATGQGLSALIQFGWAVCGFVLGGTKRVRSRREQVARR